MSTPSLPGPAPLLVSAILTACLWGTAGSVLILLLCHQRYCVLWTACRRPWARCVLTLPSPPVLVSLHILVTGSGTSRKWVLHKSLNG